MKTHRICAAVVAAFTMTQVSAALAGQATSVLAAARKAAGVENWAHSGVLLETGTKQTSGLTAQWREAVETGSGRTHETSDFGIFRTAAVWDGHNYWRQDRSGGVHRINSAFAQTANITGAWLAARGYLRPNASGAVLEELDDQTADGRSFAVVRATPPHGQPVDLWFDKASNLLARSVQIMSIDVKTVSYDDYRKVRGTLLPFKIAADFGNPADTDVIRIDRIDVVGNTGREFEPLRTADDFTVAGGKITVPVDFDGDVIVEAMLNGQGPFAFILDTGGHDILTPEAAKSLHLNPVGAGSSGGSGEGTLPVQYAHVDRMDIGGATLRNQTFSVIPLQYDAIERGAKPVLSGILGLELFERFAMKLDYRNKTLSFEPLSTYRHDGAGVAVPIFFNDDNPLLKAAIDGISGDVALDTGNSGSVIVQGIWADAHGLKQQMMSGYSSLGFGAGGASSNWSNRANFEIAGSTFPHIIASYAADKKGAFSSRTEAANVGDRILANFTLDFDYGHDVIWFEPVPGFVYPPFGRLGLTTDKERSEAFKVAAVASGTPSAEAGLQIGDEIMSVDGVPSAQMSGWDFARVMRQPPGTKVELSIVRNGQQQSVTVILRELLP
jgi:hypothetical protein